MVKLIVFSQQMAIETGKEELSIGLIRKAAKEKFRLMKPMLDAIRSGNPHKIAKYEDIRRIDLEQATIPTSKPIKSHEPKGIKRTGNYEKVEEDKKEKSVSKKVRKSNEYMEEDLRFLLQEGVRNEKTPYGVLFENDYIEHVEKWIQATEL